VRAIVDAEVVACGGRQWLARHVELHDCLSLGAAARMIILSSPEFQRLLKDGCAKLIAEPPATDSPAKAH
jgi:hypothetical protein